MSPSIDMELPSVDLTTPTRPAFKLNNKTKHSLLTELKKNMTRNVRNPKPLSQEKIKANLAKLKVHCASNGEGLLDIVAGLHPTVQGVYHLMQGQTTTIVAAIDGRADAIDLKLDDQSVKLDMQMRVLRGQLLPEDSIGMTDHELLAQNCQAVRSMQSQNIQLRARIKGVAAPCGLEERTKRLEDLEAAKAAKTADIAKKKLDMSQKKAAKELAAAEKKANKPPPKRKRVSKKTDDCELIRVDKTDGDIKIYLCKPGEKQAECDETPAFATEVKDEAESEDGLDVN